MRITFDVTGNTAREIIAHVRRVGDAFFGAGRWRELDIDATPLIAPTGESRVVKWSASVVLEGEDEEGKG